MTIGVCAKWSIIVTIGTLLFAGVFLGSYGIYQLSTYKSWNDNAVPTYAHIDAIDIVNKTCQQSCNNYCVGFFCKKCEVPCFDTFLNITYGKHHRRYNIYTNSTNYTLLLTDLAECCIINHEIRLYYNRDNPHDISIELHSSLLFWIVVVFTIIVAFVCTAFVILIYRRETKPFDYQSLYNDPLLEAYGNIPDEYPETPVILNY